MEPDAHKSIKRLSIRRFKTKVLSVQSRRPLPPQYLKALLVIGVTRHLLAKSSKQLTAMEQKQRQYTQSIYQKYQKNQRNLFAFIAPRSRRIAGLQQLVSHSQLFIDQMSLLVYNIIRMRNQPKQSESSSKLRSHPDSSTPSGNNLTQRNECSFEKAGQVETQSLNLSIQDIDSKYLELPAKVLKISNEKYRSTPRFIKSSIPKSYLITPFVGKKIKNEARHFSRFNKQLNEAYKSLQNDRSSKSGIYQYFQQFSGCLGDTECALSFRFLPDDRRLCFNQQKIIYFIQQLSTLCVAIYGSCLNFAFSTPALAHKAQQFNNTRALMSRQLPAFDMKPVQFDEQVHLLSDKMDALVTIIRSLTKATDLAAISKQKPKMTSFLLDKFSQFRYYSTYAGIEIEKTHKKVFIKNPSSNDCFEKMRKMYSNKCRPLQMNSTIL